MLALEQLSAGYGSMSVLRDVTLTVPSSSVVALLGSNGAGKTTLLRVASGMLKPTTGRVSMEGRDLTGHPAHRIRTAGVCHITEGRSIFPGLTVRENLMMFSPRGAEDEARDRSVTAFPRLGERLDQVAGTMSGGEQQMLALARAYIGKPPVVLLDEVSMGLAPRLVDEIFDFLVRLAAEGSALLLVEQYISRALQIADYVYILQRGRVTFAGEPSELAQEDLLKRYLGDSAEAAEISL